MFQAFKKITFILFLIVSNASNANSSTEIIKNKINDISNEIKTGADNFEKYIPLLKDKKVGIVTNQTGLLSNKKHVVDFLLEKKINIQTIFAPEHGFRGTADAGEHVVDGKDSKTGLSIISLYGDNKKPKPEQLSGIDVMVFDLQDVGARFYTYISSLHYVMEACAENNVPLIIFDRPNPNGRIVDGPLLEKEFTSFVGMHPIPLLHGMTIGEYAKMINGEKWLKNAAQCKLTVIPCVNYNRKMDYSLLAKPSPNLPNDQSINLYASLCLFEGTNVSMGRGTEKQFQIYGSPYLTKTNFSFTPKPNFGAKDPVYNGVECFGEDLTSYTKLQQLELKWLLKAYQNTSDKTKFFNPFFTKLAGTKKLQQQIESGTSEENIRKSWVKDLEAFKKMRMKYLIYQ
ncbi:exo-beta-N-acetylmuramidase NamZ domain-containing protein [Flavobacterium sp. FlaQc-30]|uniref:exo-beta-N-acetylmuramidase NamZ family protein n=1 Tax=Flavobacterium sp. FlaQc-30 TaxID=3374179 RepID=UPI003756DBC9